MANVLGNLFKDIADAIRSKNGETGTMKPAEFPEKIAAIQTGGGGGSGDVRYVTFLSHDGTVILGIKAVAVGDDCADPVDRGLFDAPTRESTAQYEYTFAGWSTIANGAPSSSALKAVTEDRTVYAAYTASVRYYTITYYDEDGATVLKTENLAYGSIPSYSPKKSGYEFVEWVPTPTAVTGNTSYKATWKAMSSFGSADWAEIVSIVESGNAQEYFRIGDQRIITYNGKDVTLQIIGFDHDELYSGSGKAGMTIWTKDIVQTRAFNGGPSTSGGYGLSGMANYVNSTCKGYLPEEIASSIKRVKKYYSDGKTSGSVVASNGYDLWLLSTTEIGADGYGHKSGEGAVYPFFDGTNGPRNKGASWWTRSVYTPGTNGTFAYVDSDGSMKNAVATGSRGLVFGFCI